MVPVTADNDTNDDDPTKGVALTYSPSLRGFEVEEEEEKNYESEDDEGNHKKVAFNGPYKPEEEERKE